MSWEKHTHMITSKWFRFIIAKIYKILRYVIVRILRHMCNLHIKKIYQKRSKGIKNWKITYSVILSVLSNKTNLILGYSSPLTSCNSIDGWTTLQQYCYHGWTTLLNNIVHGVQLCVFKCVLYLPKSSFQCNFDWLRFDRRLLRWINRILGKRSVHISHNLNIHQ